MDVLFSVQLEYESSDGGTFRSRGVTFMSTDDVMATDDVSGGASNSAGVEQPESQQASSASATGLYI